MNDGNIEGSKQDSFVKEEIRSFNEIISMAVQNCIIAKQNYETLNASIRLYPVSNQNQAALLSNISLYLENVTTVYDLLFAWISDNSDLHIGNVNKDFNIFYKKKCEENPQLAEPIKILSGREVCFVIPSSTIRQQYRVFHYQSWFRKLLKFAKKKGFLTKERVQRQEGKELIPEAFAH